MKLSIVTTLYSSAPYIEEFYLRATKIASSIVDEYEIVFVDDGSPDDSLQIACQLHLKDNKVKVIELSRNFGHHKAMLTGIKHAKGDYVFLIDSDLEEAPELLKSFWDELQSNADLDVVYGVQNTRKGSVLERLTGSIYFKLLNKLSDKIKVSKNLSTVRLMKRNYVNALTQFQENVFYFGPISQLVGFNQKEFYFDKTSKGASTYFFLKKYHIFLDSIVAFSAKPLYFIFYLGSVLTLASFLYMIFLVVRKITLGAAIKGWASIAVLICFFGGLNMLFMGIVSIYILHVFQETKNRPFTIVRKVYEKEAWLEREGV